MASRKEQEEGGGGESSRRSSVAGVSVFGSVAVRYTVHWWDVCRRAGGGCADADKGVGQAVLHSVVGVLLLRCTPCVTADWLYHRR